MSSDLKTVKNGLGISYFLSDILGAKVTLRGKRIGKLEDLVIIDGDLAAEVSHFYVARPFGDPALVIPWDKVKSIESKRIVIDISSIDEYITDSSHPPILLKDNIVDKKVLDTEGKEVEVVYDVKLAILNNKMYVTEVDMSHYGLLRRMGLKWLANFISSLGESLKGHTISWKYVEPLPAEIGSFEGNLKLKVLKEKLDEMHPADLADVLEQMEPNQRAAIFKSLDTERASDTLEEIDPNVQRTLLSVLTKEKIAELVNDMTPGQAADVLAVLPSSDTGNILSLINEDNRKKIQNILGKHEEKILNYATIKYVKFSPDSTVRQTLEQYRKIAISSDVLMYIYVVSDDNKLLGVIDMRELLKANNDSKIKDIMVPIVANLTPDSTLREASVMFNRYGFRALPILDSNGVILGVVPFRDMMNLKHLFLE